MKYYLIAGEASGDLHASNLMKSVRKLDPKAEFRFIGGDLMASVGGVCIKHYRNLAYMGLFPVLAHLGVILRSRKECLADIVTYRPDVLILIDYPGFNLSIAKKIYRKRPDIPVAYYISPKLWAWKGYRIKSIRRYVDKLFSILPFEVEYFAKRGYTVNYVGNPCVDAVESFRVESATRGKEKLSSTGKPVLALLAGSRRQEISRNLPIMAEALKGIDGVERFEVMLAGAPGIEQEFYKPFLDGTDIHLLTGQTYRLLENAYAALVTSGTATLETALMRVPQVVCYYMPLGRVTLLLKRLFIKVRYVSLVNLVSGRESVPELVAADMNATKIREFLIPLLSDTPQRRRQLDEYDRVAGLLGRGRASDEAAKGIVTLSMRKSADKE